LAFREPSYASNLVVPQSLYVAQLHNCALYFWQLIHNLSHNGNTLFLIQNFVSGCLFIVHCPLSIAYYPLLRFFAFDFVQSQPSGDGQAPGFHVLYLEPIVPPFPHPDEGVLSDVLCLLPVKHNAQGHPKDFILQWQYITVEVETFHRLAMP
jgi:hypothetical protein